jgi:hypothetical protein
VDGLFEIEETVNNVLCIVDDANSARQMKATSCKDEKGVSNILNKRLV